MKTLIVYMAALTVAFCFGCASTQLPETPQGEGCQSPLGFISEGHSKTGYLQAVAQGGASCQQGELTCNEGQWTGSYIFPSCTKLP